MAKQAKLVARTRDHAWAIELFNQAWEDSPHYAGIYNFTSFPQWCQQGCSTALFKTRDEARTARRGMYGFGPRKAAVRKVTVEIRRAD